MHQPNNYSKRAQSYKKAGTPNDPAPNDPGGLTKPMKPSKFIHLQYKQHCLMKFCSNKAETIGNKI